MPVKAFSGLLQPPVIRFYILGVIAVGFALRLYHLAGESLWYDELLQLDIAQQPLASILPVLPAHSAVPLDYVIGHFWLGGGRQTYWVRLPAVMLGTLSLPVAYHLGRSLLGQGAGFLFMLLLTLSPFHIRYSQEARPYALLGFGVLAAGYAFWRLAATGRGRYVVILQIGVLLFSLAHFFGLVVFVPWLLWAVIEIIFDRRRRSVLKAGAALLAGGFVALAALLALGWGPTFVEVSGFLIEAVLEPGEFILDPAEKPNTGSGPVVDWNFVRYEILSPLGAGGGATPLQLFNGLAGLGLLYLLIHKNFRAAGLLALWLILPIVGLVAFLVHRDAFFASRYILSALPPYLALVTVGLLALPRWLKCARRPWLAAALFGVIFSLVALNMGQALQQQYAVNEKENWRLAARFLAENAGPNDVIIAVNAEATMNWYRPDLAVAWDTYDELANIQTAVAQAERSWVIMSIFTEYMEEQGDQIRVWLSERGAVRLVLDPLIAVYYLGPDTPPARLLQEIQGFALPVDHALYASLARENRRRPAVAVQYFRLAIEHAPDQTIRAQYQADMEAILER